jgi:biopolymer transport protein TolQ
MHPLFLIAKSPLLQAYFESDLLGKAIFLSLLFLSFITWLLFLTKFKLTKQARLSAVKFQDIFSKKKGHPLSIDLALLDNLEREQPFSRLYQTLKINTLELLNKNELFHSNVKSDEKGDDAIFLSAEDLSLLESHLSTTLSSTSKQLEKNLFFLSTIVTLAPFLGLLGTVWGILETFAELQHRSGGSANEMVMGGLSMALGTTVVGLLVAIPALLAYNYLKNSIDHFSSEMEDFSYTLLAAVEMQYRKVD